MRKTILIGAATAIAAAAPAFALDTELSATEAVKRCGVVKDNLDRLACFDSLYDALAPTEATAPAAVGEIVAPAEIEVAEKPSGRLVVMTEEEAEQLRAAPVKTPTPPEATPVPDVYESRIAGVSYDPLQRLTITLDNGERWKQNDTMRAPKPKAGAKVEVHKGAFGAWFVKIEPNSRKIKMRRVE